MSITDNNTISYWDRLPYHIKLDIECYMYFGTWLERIKAVNREYKEEYHWDDFFGVCGLEDENETIKLLYNYRQHYWQYPLIFKHHKAKDKGKNVFKISPCDYILPDNY